MQHVSTSPSRPRRVYIYSHHSPAPNTTGAGLAICSQVQAFLDLGFEVEFLHLHLGEKTTPPSFSNIAWTLLQRKKGRLPFFARLAYLFDWPKRFTWRALYGQTQLLQEAERRIRQDPEAVHVFNYLTTAHILPSLPSAHVIWACHEIESEYYERNFNIDRAREQRGPLRWERRKLKRIQALERVVARKAKLILCVSAAEALHINRDWGLDNAAYLPISMINAPSAVSPARRAPGEPLRLLHLGDVTHLPTLSSLEFLFTQVFPLLEPSILAGLEMDVVGKLPSDDPRVKMVMDLGRPYPQVRFTGFAQDLQAVYRKNHLQLVASRQATGVRTRIIESWAHGLPVLSTTVGAGGVEHLAPGKNILISDGPADFANALTRLVNDSSILEAIALSGHASYVAHFGRETIATQLRELLARHVGCILPEAAARTGEQSPRAFAANAKSGAQTP